MRSDNPGERWLFAMNQEYASVNGTARRDPADKLRTVGMAGIFVDVADARGDLDFIALDAYRLDAIVEETSERALRLEAHQQHRRAVVAKASV